MLVFRVLKPTEEYISEIRGYQNKLFASFSNGKRYKKGINSFYYGENSYKLHFFVFMEDAKNYGETRRNPNECFIGVYDLDADYILKHSGFGTQYPNTSIPCLEIALPTMKIIEENFIPLVPDEIEDLEHLMYYSEEEIKRICTKPFCSHYFKLKGVRITGNLLSLESNHLIPYFRESYLNYQERYKEFLEAYGINWSQSKDELTQLPPDEEITQDHIRKRKIVLTNNNIL